MCQGFISSVVMITEYFWISFFFLLWKIRKFFFLTFELSNIFSQVRWPRWKTAQRRKVSSTTAATSFLSPRWQKSSTSTAHVYGTSAHRCSTTYASRSASSRRSRPSLRTHCRYMTMTSSTRVRQGREQTTKASKKWVVVVVSSSHNREHLIVL